jgi:hypothetical protein
LWWWDVRLPESATSAERIGVSLKCPQADFMHRSK